MESEGYPSFQKSPVRGRPNVSKLVPKKLTRTTTDDTQTAINRVVHEALARGGTVSSPEVAEEVKQRVAVVLQAKEDELTGKITHQQRLQLIKLVATLSVEEAMEEARRLQSSTREDAEQKVKSTSMLPLIWRRMLCGYFLSQDEVLVLGACCRFLRQDHALGLECFVLPSHLEGLEDTVCTAPLAAKPMPPPALKRLVFKFRYSQKLVASTRGFRFQNSELELLPLAQLRVLDLSFCYTLSEDALLAGLRSTLCLSELSLRGCSQLTSPATEETLSELKGLVQLDVRGCSSLNSDSILLAAADALKQLTTLRLGYTCKDELWPEHQVMPLETFSSAAFAQLGASHSRLQHLELDIGLMFRWTERDGASVVDDAVKSLMSLKHLEVLLLWNCVGLQMNTFRCILDRLEGEGIDTVGIDDCYNDFDAYFHVVPSAWGIRTQRELQKGVNSEAMLPPGRTGGRAVLIGHNVCRNREELLQNTVSPLLLKSKPRQLVLQCEADTSEILELASDRLEELEILTSCNAPDDYLGVFVCSMLRRCPQLKRLKICTQGAHMSRQNLHGYEEMLKVLAGGCPQLEILDVRLATTFSDIRGRIETFSVEYYDDDQTRVAPGALQCHYNTLRDLFRSCPLLATLHLLPPAKEDRVAFWKFCCEAGFAQSSMVLSKLTPVRGLRPAEDGAQELQLMQQIRQAPVREFAIMNGFPLTTDMSAAILQFGQLRRLGLHQVDWQSLRELLVPLAEHCPDIEELWLLDINVPEEGGEVFVEALRSLRLRELHVKNLSPASVEKMVVEALPELAQQSERTLRSLECCGVGSQRLLSLLARARKLRRLFVNASETKDAKGNHKEVCPDFGGGQEDLLLKVITRCPHLEVFSIDWTRPPPPEDEPGEAERTKALVKTLQLGRKLWDMNCINVSFYTGLQYSDGHVFTPQPDSDSDD